MLRMKRPLSWPLPLFGQNLVPFLRGTDLEMQPVTEGYSGRIRKIIGNFGIPEHVCRMEAYSLCSFKICRRPEYYKGRAPDPGSGVSPMRLFPECGASVRLAGQLCASGSACSDSRNGKYRVMRRILSSCGCGAGRGLSCISRGKHVPVRVCAGRCVAKKSLRRRKAT